MGIFLPAFYHCLALFAGALHFLAILNVVFGYVKRKFLAAPFTISFNHAEEVVCKKVFTPSRDRPSTHLTFDHSPGIFRFELVHAAFAKTMATWCRHLGV